MNVRLILSMLLVLGCASAEDTGVEPVVAARDGGVDGWQLLPDGAVAIAEPDAAIAPPPAVDAAPRPPPPKPDAPPPPPKPDAAPPPPWTDQQKCENMCQSYCVHKHMCDGSSVDKCRMTIDQADGGTCKQRAHLFEDISQQKVEACIDAIEAMSCPDFLRMYSTGDGIPRACKGILY